MKSIYLFALSSLFLVSSCGQDAASKETEARVVASIQQTLGTTNTSYVNEVHTWYQSDVPNLIKLNPKTESIYQTHAAILQEVASNEPKLLKRPIVTPDEAQGISAKYKQLVDESAARVQELSALATSKITMSEADQLKYVSDLADKQTHHLALVRYYTKRTDAAITQREQKQKHSKYMRETWGLE
jgi:hypothetical protein